MTFQYLMGVCKEYRGGLSTRLQSDKTRGKGFKLKESRFRLAIRKKNIYSEDGEVLKQVAQRTYGCLVPEDVQGQITWSSELPGLVEGVSANGRGDWN